MQEKINYINKFLENNKASLREALHKIDINKKGFLIISNQDSVVVGVLTDGDIRRALLKFIPKIIITLQTSHHLMRRAKCLEWKKMNFYQL